MSNKLIYTLGCLVLSLAGCGGGSSSGQDAGTSAASMVHFVGNIFGYGNLDGTVSEAAFNQPRGIAADSAGNLYLTEESNHSIRKISALGVVSTLAGGVRCFRQCQRHGCRSAIQ